jgi:NADPH-dependent stearoyl-CoA 9-desaturase
MAIAEITEYAHLSDTDIDALAAELCAIRQTRRGPRGAKDKTYIQRTSTSPPGW